MDRLFNYIFLLALVYIFALWAPADPYGSIIVGAVAAVIFCGVAFVMKWLSLDGAAAAMVMGTIAFGIGGWPIATALLLFFLSSSVISIGSKKEEASDQPVRRNGQQVWANGFWICLWLVLGVVTNALICWIAAAAALATATADTWGTELGSRRFGSASTYLATSFQEVPAGSEGGVSWPGLGASLAGSTLIALIIFLGYPVSAVSFLLLMLAGFAGSLFDSYLGASIQGSSYKLQASRLNIDKTITIDNDMVNFASTGLGSLLILILNLIFI